MDIDSHNSFILGLRVNFKKSNLVPSSEQPHRGYIISTVNDNGHVWIRIPMGRISIVKHDINIAIKKRFVTARALARICGQYISMAKAILLAKLLLRNLYLVLRFRVMARQTSVGFACHKGT